MFRLPETSGNATGSTAVENETLASLALHLQTISESLVKTQKDAAADEVQTRIEADYADKKA